MFDVQCSALCSLSSVFHWTLDVERWTLGVVISNFGVSTFGVGRLLPSVLCFLLSANPLFPNALDRGDFLIYLEGLNSSRVAEPPENRAVAEGALICRFA